MATPQTSLRDLAETAQSLSANIAKDLISWDKKLASVHTRISEERRIAEGRSKAVAEREAEMEKLDAERPEIQKTLDVLNDLGWVARAALHRRRKAIQMKLVANKKARKTAEEIIASIKAKQDGLEALQDEASSIVANIEKAVRLAVVVRLAFMDIQCALKFGITKLNIEQLGGQSKEEQIDQVIEVGRVVFNYMITHRQSHFQDYGAGRSVASDTEKYMAQADVIKFPFPARSRASSAGETVITGTDG